MDNPSRRAGNVSFQSSVAVGGQSVAQPEAQSHATRALDKVDCRGSEDGDHWQRKTMMSCHAQVYTSPVKQNQGEPSVYKDIDV